MKQGNVPITKSAKKAFRQSIKKRKTNIRKKKRIKELIKEARGLALEKKVEEAKKLLPQIYKALDKTAKAGTIKKNNASRKKARITKLINKTQRDSKNLK